MHAPTDPTIVTGNSSDSSVSGQRDLTGTTVDRADGVRGRRTPRPTGHHRRRFEQEGGHAGTVFAVALSQLPRIRRTMQKEITGYKANAEMKAFEKEAAEEAARKQAQTVGVTAGSSRSLRPKIRGRTALPAGPTGNSHEGNT
jgi:hypothetical protein